MQPETNLSATQFAAVLDKINACQEAREWTKDKDYNTAWNTCQKPAWMFFLINAVVPLTEINDELLVCRFAREVLHLNPDPRVLACIEVREAWARGEVTDAQRKAVIATAEDAVRDAARDTGWTAAWSAARAAVEDSALDSGLAAAWAAAMNKSTLDSTQADAWFALRDIQSDFIRETWDNQCDFIREIIEQPILGIEHL